MEFIRGFVVFGKFFDPFFPPFTPVDPSSEDYEFLQPLCCTIFRSRSRIDFQVEFPFDETALFADLLLFFSGIRVPSQFLYYFSQDLQRLERNGPLFTFPLQMLLLRNFIHFFFLSKRVLFDRRVLSSVLPQCPSPHGLVLRRVFIVIFNLLWK